MHKKNLLHRLYLFANDINAFHKACSGGNLDIKKSRKYVSGQGDSQIIVFQCTSCCTRCTANTICKEFAFCVSVLVCNIFYDFREKLLF